MATHNATRACFPANPVNKLPGYDLAASGCEQPIPSFMTQNVHIRHRVHERYLLVPSLNTIINTSANDLEQQQ
jgi:hypothetical protein